MSLLDRNDATNESFFLGGKSIPILTAPRPRRKSALHNIFFGLKSLFGGMAVTIKYFLRPSTWITQQYPENRNELKMFERYRSELVLKYDEKGLHNCTGCKICDEACPNKSIQVIDMKGSTGKKEIDRYIWHMDTCTFCNLCVMVCPHDALEMTGRFESSVMDRRLLVYQLNRYAGPTKKTIEKAGDLDPSENLRERRTFYEGSVPLAQASVQNMTQNVAQNTQVTEVSN